MAKSKQVNYAHKYMVLYYALPALSIDAIWTDGA